MRLTDRLRRTGVAAAMAVVTGDKVAACSAAAAEPAVSRLGQTRTVPVTLGTPPAT